MFKTLLATTALVASLASAAYAAPAIGLANGNQLFTFDTSTPSIVGALQSISGLTNGDTTLSGLDFRPRNNVLYGLGSSGTLYTVNYATGVASVVAVLNVALSNTAVDISFNPTVDRIRTVGTGGQNLRSDPTTGATTTDGTINGPGASAPSIVAVAYTNQVSGAVATTMLFDIDSTGNLLLQSNPNAGTLTSVGALGVSGITGFDIDGLNANAAFASTATTLYSVNLSNGAATSVGTFGVGGVTDIAIIGVPEPMSLALLGMGLAGLAAVRRRV